MRSYVTSLTPPVPAGERLAEYASLYGKAMRSAYARAERDVRAGREPAKTGRKPDITARFKLTSRQANAVLMDADGKRAGILALYGGQIGDLQGRLSKKKSQLKRNIALLAEHRIGKKLHMAPSKAALVRRQVYHAKTKIASLTAKIAAIKALMTAGQTHLTFGTKKMLRQRTAIDDNGAGLAGRALAQWRADWDQSRNGQFTVLGSKDESGGCVGCVATAQADGSFTLSVRMPDALGGGHVVLTGVRFHYGADRLRYALAQQIVRASSKKEQQAKLRAAELLARPAAEPVETLDPACKKPNQKAVSQTAINGGVAVSWRFMRQMDGSWRIGFSTEVAAVKLVTHRQLGAVGVDVNAGFISVAETDRFGNILYARNIQTSETGLSAGQRDAARGEAVKAVIALCVKTGKPLVLEQLDFTQKKRDLALRSKTARRKLSALAYASLYNLFGARALDAGVEVLTIDPAYTSTQGHIRYAARRGWTVHQCAAGVIARRGMGFHERAPVSGKLRLPVGETLIERAIPVDIARSFVSRRWPLLHKELRRTIESYYRGQRIAPPKARLGSSCAVVVEGATPSSNRAGRATTP